MNIFKQTDNFVEFLDVLIKLTKKPDDKESLEKIVDMRNHSEYKKKKKKKKVNGYYFDGKKSIVLYEDN